MLMARTKTSPMMVNPSSFRLIIIASTHLVDRPSHPQFVGGIARAHAIYFDCFHPAIAAVSVEIQTTNETNGSGGRGHLALHLAAAGHFFRRRDVLSRECHLYEVFAEIGVTHMANSFQKRGTFRRSRNRNDRGHSFTRVPSAAIR